MISALVFLGAGCLFTDDASMIPSTSTEQAAIWIVSDISAGEIRYQPIEWFSGDEAEAEARKDGCVSACTSNGFYWRYQDEQARQTWTLGDTSSIVVRLICNTDDCLPDDPAQDHYETVSFGDLVVAEASCQASLENCPYYALGTRMDFFDVTFTDEGHIQSMIQHYVP